MAFYSHEEPTFHAERVFTDRKEPIALFETAFTAPQERGEHRVICWHGVGGQGKSSLHDEIRRRIADHPDVALAGLDFDVPRHRRLEDAMLKLRGDLAGRGLSFPTFDLAFARHFALERPGENIRQVHPQLYRRGESQIIDDMLDWSEAGVDIAVEGVSLAVPGLNLLYKYGARLTGRLGDWWTSRTVKDKLVGLDHLSTSKIAECLPQYLGFDIWRARAEIGCPRIVITIDTHEKLAGDELRGDAWLQSLVRETPGALILIFGRDMLRWAEIDVRWKDVLEQHLLGELSDDDADLFLSQVPIPEDEIRARIVGSADGLPHYLDLAVSTYEDILNRGKIPALGDFGTTPAEVRERFFDHLSESERRELVVASYPESLSEELFLDLSDGFLGGAGNVNWARLKRRSFMTEGPDGRLAMHTLMGEALQDQDAVERAELFTRIHDYLFKRYADRAEVADALSVTADAERSLASAAFHARKVEPNRVFEWLQKTYKPFYHAARWRALEELYLRILPIFPETCRERGWVSAELGKVYNVLAQSALAEACFEQAVEIYSATIGEDHVDYATTLHNFAVAVRSAGQVERAEALLKRSLNAKSAAFGDSSSSYATTLAEFANVRTAQGRYGEAEALCERALSIFSSTLGKRHPHYGTTLFRLGNVQKMLGRFAEAESHLNQALEIYTAAFGEEHPYCAAGLRALATLYREVGRTAEADALLVQAVAIQKNLLGDVHPEYAATLHDLAVARQKRGHLGDAIKMFEEALAIKKVASGERDTSVAATLHDLATTRHLQGHPDEAARLFEEALAIKKASYGEAHPEFAVTLYELGCVMQELGRHAEACTAFERALAVLAQTFGDTHAYTIVCMASLAAQNALSGNIEEARTMVSSALQLAGTLPESHDAVTGQVRLLWARGLAGAGNPGEAREEAQAAEELLVRSLGADAQLAKSARDLLGKVEGA